LKDGVFIFRSLSYFKEIEDEQVRGDKYEGILKHSKEEGIEIKKSNTGKTNKLNLAFESNVDSENIFIFCTSQKLSPELATEFNSDVCVEFLRPEKIIAGLSSAIARRKKVKPNKLFHGEIAYYKEDAPPGITWAFPDRIAMRKLSCFQAQEEYRFMFSTNGALEFNRTEQKLKAGVPEISIRNEPYPVHKLKIGNIKKWCSIHEFT
jgi:hypothetical protein